MHAHYPLCSNEVCEIADAPLSFKSDRSGSLFSHCGINIDCTLIKTSVVVVVIILQLMLYRGLV